MLGSHLLAVDLRCELGEGPTWDYHRRRGHFVDIDRGVLFEFEMAEPFQVREVLRRETTLGAALHADGGGFLIAQGGTLQHVGQTGRVLREFEVIAPGVASRLNDGAADPAGRYLVGSLALDGRSGQERLWRLETDGSITVIDDDLNLSNGIGWSPDGGTLYSVDSIPGIIWVRSYDADSGRTGVRHKLAELTDGTPDGLTVDALGNLWVAIWGRGEIRVLDPGGSLLEVVEVAAPHPTSCAFVGDELRTLLITTAGRQVGDVPRTQWCGALFVAEVAVSGRPTTGWVPVV